MVVQFSNFVATAQRHPSFDEPPLTWGGLRAVRRQLEAGQFDAVAKAHPFPSRLFDWAFEYEMAAEHKAGRSVDIQAFSEPSQNLYRYVDLTIIPKITGYRDISLNIAGPQEERTLIEAGARKLDGELELLTSLPVEGQIGPWNYVRRFDSSGHVHQRYWRNGLIRVWADRGSVSEKHNEVCVSFEKAGEECIARVYEHHGVMFAFSASGQFVSAFRRQPVAPSSLPRPA
jgi:hypothetical protein